MKPCVTCDIIGMGGNPWETPCKYIKRAGQRPGHQICYLIRTRLCLPCKYLLFLYRFEAIFNWHFSATYTIDTELMWHHVSELQANSKVPTYEVMGGTLAPVDKECVGSLPMMFLFTLDKLSYVYQCVSNTDMQYIIAYEMLSFASDRCTE